VFLRGAAEAMSFLQDVLTEVMGLFPGPYIHIAHEVSFHNWNDHSLDQALTNSLGLTNIRGTYGMQKYQGHFTQQIANLSRARAYYGRLERDQNGGVVTNAVVGFETGTSSERSSPPLTGIRRHVALAVLLYQLYENFGVTWSNEPARS